VIGSSTEVKPEYGKQRCRHQLFAPHSLSRLALLMVMVTHWVASAGACAGGISVLGTELGTALQSKPPYIAFVGRVLSIVEGQRPHPNYPALSIPSKTITFEILNDLGGAFPATIEVGLDGQCTYLGDSSSNIIGQVLWMVITKKDDGKYYQDWYYGNHG
jgi:hypothetical protein